jgi:hypothetical protein
MADGTIFPVFVEVSFRNRQARTSESIFSYFDCITLA